MDDAGVESDASALTSLDELELAWDLAASPRRKPHASAPSQTAHSARGPGALDVSTSDATVTHLCAGPESPSAAEAALESSSPRRALRVNLKRGRRPRTAPDDETSSNDESRVTGADEGGSGHQAQKRAKGDADVEVNAALGEPRCAAPGKKRGAGRKAARTAQKLGRKAAAEEGEAPPMAVRIKTELRMLGRDYFAATEGEVAAPRSSRRPHPHPVPKASPDSSVIVSVSDAHNTTASPAECIGRRSSVTAASMRRSNDAGTPTARRQTFEPCSAGSAPPKLDEPLLSKKERAATVLPPAIPVNAAVPGSSADSAAPPVAAPTATGLGLSPATVAALPARRAHKPPKRYVDEVDAALLQEHASPKRKAPPPPVPPPPPKVQIKSLRELGLDCANRERQLAGFPKTDSLFPSHHSSDGKAPARQAVLVQPQDPELNRPKATIPLAVALPPFPPSIAAPVAGPSHAPPTPAPPLRPKAPTAVASKPSKPSRPRARHPALDSRTAWVPVERDLRITAAGKPPIWCQGRQELCESLEYFRSYQGGHYDTQERCLGYLLDGFPSPSDACAEHGKVIISHGGGCGEVLPSGYRLRASQTREGTRVRALRNCMETRTPVVLLAGAMYDHFPRLKEMGEGGVRYAVLGHYLVTDIWAEGEPVEGATNGKFFVRFKVRFEWLESQGKPWFADVIGKDDVLSSPLPSTVPTPLVATSTAALSAGPTPAPIPTTLPPLPSLPADVPLASVSAASSATNPANPLAGLRFKRVSPVVSVAPTVASGSDMDISVEEESRSPRSPGSDGTVDSGFVDATTPAAVDSGTVQCASCGVVHKKVYQEEVACYNEECARFFQVDGAMPLAGSLIYLPSFLSPTPSLPSSDLVPQPLAPRTLQSLSGAAHISDYSVLAWRGFGCAACGRLSSRVEWTRLVCAGCGAQTDATARVFAAAELEAQGTASAHTAAAEPAFLLPPYGATRLFSVRGYDGYSVDFSPAHGNGVARVHHLWPVELGATKEADSLFEEYQGIEAGALFRRNKLARHCAVGALLCQQFTFNAGERYSHAVSMETYPFAPPPSASTTDTAVEQDEYKKPVLTCAPKCARDARDYLKGVVRSVVSENEQTDFNEILSVSYMTGGKMNYHDDGERGLGPYVASVSLGSDAIMSFRVKVRKQRRKKGGEDDDADADDEGDAGGGKKKNRSKSRVVLKARLKHGHVLIMEGADMQKLFEHKVEPEGLRFAATARWIGPDHLLPRSKSSSVQPVVAPVPAPSRFAYQNASQPKPAMPPLDVRAPAPSHFARPPIPSIRPSALSIPFIPTGPSIPSIGAMPSNTALYAAVVPAFPPLKLPASHPTFPRVPPSRLAGASSSAAPGVPPGHRFARDLPRARPPRPAPPPPHLLHPAVYAPVPPRVSSSGSGMRIPVLIGPPIAAPDEPTYPRASGVPANSYAAPSIGMYSRAVGVFSPVAGAVTSSFAGRGTTEAPITRGETMVGSAYRHIHPEAFHPRAPRDLTGAV
ncbi:hypothetical protein JCM3770_002995 [Rhodotorula araucariae]